MKTFKKILIELILPFILCWFFMSVLVDIVAIPTIFKNISSLEEGGKIGMIVFGRFNCFEIFFALLILLGVLSIQNKSKVMISLSIILLLLSLTYTFYMTPLIANTSIQIHKLSINDAQYEILQERHNFYHILYRYFDTAKLLLLLFFASFVLRFNIKKNDKGLV